MAVYSTGDNKYGIVQETTTNSAILTGDNIILATEKEINIDLGLNQINKPKASGLSYQRTGNGRDFRKGNQLPMITLPFDGNSDNTALLLAAFFQNVTESGTYIYQFDPYTSTAHRSIKSSDTSEYSFTLVKQNESSGVYGEYMCGCIVRSITLGSSRGEPMSVSAEILGMTYDTQESMSPSFTEFGSAVIMHFDWTAATLATVSKDIESWQVTMTNNA